jgi:hypothetical protein
MLHGEGHDQATGPQQNQQNDPPNEQTWQYSHNAILLLQKGIQRILVSQFNLSNLGKGMEILLDNGDNLLMLLKLTNAITAGSVIKAAT